MYRRLAMYLVLTFAVIGGYSAEGSAQEKNLKPLPLNGQDRLSRLAKERLEDPLRGVVVNRTVTVQGHDFYRFFSMTWQEIDSANQYSISVYERPSARWGSEIWIEYRRDRVFHIFLPPARSRTKEISQQAAHITYEQIENNELDRILFQSEDLGEEEM